MSHDEQSIEEEAVEILRELAMHVDYDSGVNGSKFTKKPYGRVPIGPDGFWPKNIEHLLKQQFDGAAVQVVRDVNNHLINSGGILPIENKKGSHWQRIQSFFDRPPDFLRDVVGPIIRREISGP